MYKYGKSYFLQLASETRGIFFRGTRAANFALFRQRTSESRGSMICRITKMHVLTTMAGLQVDDVSIGDNLDIW